MPIKHVKSKLNRSMTENMFCFETLDRNWDSAKFCTAHFYALLPHKSKVWKISHSRLNLPHLLVRPILHVFSQQTRDNWKCTVTSFPMLSLLSSPSSPSYPFPCCPCYPSPSSPSSPSPYPCYPPHLILAKAKLNWKCTLNDQLPHVILWPRSCQRQQLGGSESISESNFSSLILDFPEGFLAWYIICCFTYIFVYY